MSRNTIAFLACAVSLAAIAIACDIPALFLPAVSCLVIAAFEPTHAQKIVQK